MLTRRQTVAGIGALAAACSTRSLWAKKKDEIILWGAPAAPTILLAVAARFGQAAKKQPFKLRTWRNPDQLRAGLSNGTIQLTMVPSYVSANFYNRGQKVRFHTLLTRGINYMMSKNPEIKSFDDLVGQKIVMPFKNDMPDLVLHILAEKMNLELQPDQVTYTSVPPESVSLFLNKDFPCAMLPEPLASVSILKGKKQGVSVYRSINLQDVWNQAFGTTNAMPLAGVLVTDEFYKQHAEFMDELQQDLQQAAEWVMANPRSAAEIGSQYLPVPVPALEMALPYANLCAIPCDSIADEIIAFFTELYRLNPKILGGKIPDKALFGRPV